MPILTAVHVAYTVNSAHFGRLFLYFSPLLCLISELHLKYDWVKDHGTLCVLQVEHCTRSGNLTSPYLAHLSGSTSPTACCRLNLLLLFKASRTGKKYLVLKHQILQPPVCVRAVGPYINCGHVRFLNTNGWKQSIYLYRYFRGNSMPMCGLYDNFMTLIAAEHNRIAETIFSFCFLTKANSSSKQKCLCTAQ